MSPQKALGYSLIGGGAAYSAFNAARLAHGDYTATPSLMDSFGWIATGLGLLTVATPETHAEPTVIVIES